MLKITNKKRFTLFIVCVVIIIGGIVFAAYRAVKNYQSVPAIERMSLSEAAKQGEKKPVQLLVQIANAQGKGILERGDVVLVAPPDKQFSIAEQEGFLIVKVNLTDAEQQLMTLALKKRPGIFSSNDPSKQDEQIKSRKFAVDLKKIGIADEVTVGKLISDKVFEDDVVLQKQIP